ncbi:MAG: hypothetical protein V2A67_05845 [Bacteroidota bacterium]
MKTTNLRQMGKELLFILILAGMHSLSLSSQTSNQYLEFPDTLILKTHQEKGVSLFQPGAGSLEFRDSAELKKLEVFPKDGIIYPKNLDSLKVTCFITYLYPLQFYNSISKEVATQSNRENRDRIILVVKGLYHGDEICIVDQNHNFDLTDDPIRKFTNTDWYDRDNLIPCEYDVMVDGAVIQKTGWKNILFTRGHLLEFTSQHVIAEFSVNGIFYRIGVKDDNSTTFCYVRPQLALLTQNGIMKDTLTQRDFVWKNEFVFLGDQPYRFLEFYNGCGTIVLTKEKEYNKQVGIQMGLLAPGFKIKTVTAEIIGNDQLTGKPIMIVNLSGCSGPETYEKYKKFFGKFSGEYHIIALEPKISSKLPGILVDTDDEFNKDFYLKYRNAYSSYDVYHIGLDGRIKDFFSIFSWETSMIN